MGAVIAALPQSDPNVVAPIIETASSNYQTEIIAVAVVGLAIGVIVLALKRGWGLFKSFAR